jgi:hypothetical protein
MRSFVKRLGYFIPSSIRHSRALLYNRVVFRVFLACFLPAIVCAADLRVDHVTIVGRNLESMRASLKAIGLRSEYGGKHSNHATEMASISFPDGSYLELIAIQPDADPGAVKAHYWAKQMLGDAGPCAWAVRVNDVATEAAALQRNGIEINPPQSSGRTRPDGKRLEWRTARVGPEPNGTFFPFLIQDLTDRALRAFPNGAPASREFEGVAYVVIAVRDLGASTQRYRQAFGLPEPLTKIDIGLAAKVAMFPHTPVVLVAAALAESPIGERIQKVGEGPFAFILKTAGTVDTLGPRSNWFGESIAWFSPEKLGWRLGFE